MRGITNRLWEPNCGYGSVRSQTQGHRQRAGRAKPEVLNSVGFGRARRRVVFEAKQSSISQIAERSRTGGIATLVDHHTPTTSVHIEISPMRPRAVFHAAIRFEPLALHYLRMSCMPGSIGELPSFYEATAQQPCLPLRES